MSKNKKNLNILKILGIILLLLLTAFGSYQWSQKKSEKQLKDAIVAADEFRAESTIYRDSMNRLHNDHKALIANKELLNSSLETKDSMLNEVLNQARRYKNTIFSLKSGNEYLVNSLTQAIGTKYVVTDTITKDSFIFILKDAVYSGSYSDEWTSWQVTASKDEIKNEYELTDGIGIVARYEGKGLFKRKEAVVDYWNSNPYTTNNEVRSIVVPSTESWITINATVGYGIIFVNQEVAPRVKRTQPAFGPGVMIGVGFDIVRFPNGKR